jgi:hypothetical protein
MKQSGYMLESPSIRECRGLPPLTGENLPVRSISREVVADPSETTRPTLATLANVTIVAHQTLAIPKVILSVVVRVRTFSAHGQSSCALNVKTMNVTQDEDIVQSTWRHVEAYCWKASSAILNTLLTILNERKFDNDGQRIACPLQLCVAASNEWPGGNGDSGKELGALFDRFLLRKTVAPIASARGLDRLLWAPTTVHLSTTITPDELNQAQSEAACLPWTDRAKDALGAILREARTEGIIPGDRRMKKAVTVAQAAAWLEGHAQVEPDSLEILAHVLWDDPTEQPSKLAKIVGRIANPEGMKINTLLVEAEQIISGTDLKDLAQTATACKKLAEVHAQLSAAPGARAKTAAEHVAAEVKRIRLASVESL